jgi:hypothetical protein
MVAVAVAAPSKGCGCGQGQLGQLLHLPAQACQGGGIARATPATVTATTAMAVGQSRVEEGQGAAGPAICTTHVPAAEMACGVDPGTSVLEGSNIQENWATDFGGLVGGGGGDKAGVEAETSLAPSLVAGVAAAPL